MSWGIDEAYDAMVRVEQLLRERNELIKHCYYVGHGPLTPQELRRFVTLADEISGLYAGLSEHYRRLANRDRERT